MDKTPIIIVAVIIILAGALFFVLHPALPQRPSVTPAVMPAGIVLFYGDTCPHCKVVEDYISQNKIADKVKFTELEVFQNQANAQLLINTGTSCKLPADETGSVPLLWDGSKCYLGQDDVIGFFKAQAGIK